METTLAETQVFFDDVPAPLLFVRNDQINAVVPNKPYLRDQVPLYFTANGLPSNQVALWVE